MNWSRFSNPASEPRDPERQREIEDEKADRWHDQAVDREEKRRPESQMTAAEIIGRHFLQPKSSDATDQH